MCGIRGVYYLGAEGRERAAASPDPTPAMAGAIVHRGPDADGFHADGRVRLGHRRLRIIDLEGGIQPMSTEDGRVWITFNGEIFNFQELRSDLEAKGHRFRTKSDTEVILHLWLEHGEACVTRLRGQFAFAIWDASRELMFVARDRLGIKPLYYAVDGERLLFASEAKSILAALDEVPPIDETAVVDYFTYLYVPAPKTIYRGISKLEPGHSMRITPEGHEISRYWDLEFADPGSTDEASAARDVLESLREAVRVRLVSDVPLGAFLSGGIDSSAVAALMAEEVRDPIRTFSVGFREAAFDELPYARSMAERIGSRHFEKVVPADPATVFDRIGRFYDEPFADSSAIPTYTVSGITREEVTVALSGDGGDENFAGYRRYRFDRLENQVRRWIPRFVRRTAVAGLARVYPKADWLPQPLRAKTLLGNLAQDPDRGYFLTQSALPRSILDTMLARDLVTRLRDYDPFDTMRPHFERAPSDPLSRIQYVDFKTYLPDDILTKVDRASMAHSLEVRVPILDHRFVERFAALPAHQKVRGGRGKHALREALRARIPASVLDGTKRGFDTPLKSWMRGPLRGAVAEAIEALPRDWFHKPALTRVLAEHEAGKRDHGRLLWSLLVLEHWRRRHAVGGLAA